MERKVYEMNEDGIYKGLRSEIDRMRSIYGRKVRLCVYAKDTAIAAVAEEEETDMVFYAPEKAMETGYIGTFRGIPVCRVDDSHLPPDMLFLVSPTPFRKVKFSIDDGEWVDAEKY